MLDNPTHGVARPKEGANEGKTPALSDAQAAALLEAPQGDTLKSKRDRAILAVLLYHAVRLAEVCGLRVKEFSDRKGVKHFRVHGNGGKIRFILAHPRAVQLLEEYFDVAGHRSNLDGWLFRPPTKLAKQSQAQPSTDSIYRNVVMRYCKRLGISMQLLGPHALRATSATNALQHGSDIAEVQEWLGHSSISTARLYDRRKMRAEDSPTFKVKF